MNESGAAKQSFEKKVENNHFLFEKIQKITEKTRKRIKFTIDEYVDYVEALIAVGRNFIVNYPGRDRIEEKFDKIIKNIATQINLPSNAETEKLTVAINLLNQRLDALNKDNNNR